MGKPPPKIILVDTNVLIRATFRKRSPVSLRIYQAIKEQTCILATSPAILAEIRDVIGRDYIIALTHTTPAQRTRYMNELHDISLLTKGQTAVTQKSQDRKDNKFLVCASEAQADYLGLDHGVGHFRPPRTITTCVYREKNQVSIYLPNSCEIV